MMISNIHSEKAELSPLDIAELARVVKDHRIQSYRIIESRREDDCPGWRETVLAEAAHTLRQRLGKWADCPIWIEKYVTQKGEWITVFLSEGEKKCAEKRLRAPRRNGAGYILNTDHKPQTTALFEQIPLAALLDDQARIERLYGRLDKKCVAPYTPKDCTDFDLSKARMIWTWDNGEVYPTTLLCAPMVGVADGPAGEYPVCIPAEWGPLCRGSYWHGSLHLHEGFSLVVCNAEGRYGLIRLRQLQGPTPQVVGQWFQSCSWAYLSGGNGTGSSILEATCSNVPDDRGELVCDLLDAQDGHRINPPGIKALMGSINYRGAIVVNEAGFGRFHRVLGRVNRQGVLCNGQTRPSGEGSDGTWVVDDLRWLEIGSESERLTAVRSAENGLWGYVDQNGAISIAPQFGDVWAFNYGTAEVQPKGSSFWGLINTSGQWVLQPEWAYLKRWSKRIIVAEDAKLRWGAINAQGKIIVEFRSLDDWMAHPEVIKRLEREEKRRSWSENNETGKRLTLVETIAEIYKIEFRKKARQAFLDCSTSLVGVEGIFDADTSERDLKEVGVWGREVRLLRDKTDGILQPGKGETGRIGCSYPVGLSTFDLSVEAPVSGLATQPEAAIGIPWRDLELIRGQSGKTFLPDIVKNGIWAAWNMSTDLLSFLLLFIRMGVAGICLHVILRGVYKFPLVPAVPGLLCLGYFTVVVGKFVMETVRRNSFRAQEIQSRASADSKRFFWWNLLAFFGWAILVVLFKGKVDSRFVLIWALAACGSLVWMLWRILRVGVPPRPVDMIKEVKAAFRNQVETD
ncbi:MAG: WG repeat-containing protein [Desulfobulbus sp.]|nr:WG repeat-containing protein [Desulfobulbus sp.]